jgi:N-acylneuraminate cytidylyltransferase/CMP-N,N'-diacetyllegionaminic acid synthase
MAGILGIVATRGGARGIHNTYTRNLANQPVVAYSLKECEKSKHLQKCILSTDSKEVSRAAALYNVNVIMRPSVGDTLRKSVPLRTPLVEIVKHALEELKSAEGYEPGVVVLLPAEFPLRRAGQIDEAIEKLEATGADSVVSVCPAEQSPYEMVKLEGDKAVPFVEDTGEKTRVYRLNDAIHVFRPSLVLEQGWKKLSGGDMRAVVMKQADCVSVETRYGFMRAEAILKDRKKDIFR